MTISPRFKSYLWLSVGCICLMLVMLAIWVFQLDRELRSRIEGQWFLPPVEIYSAPVRIHPEQTLSPMELRDHLLALGFRQREPHLRLFPGDFSLWDRQQCQVHLTEALSEDVSTCVTMLMNRGLPATTAAMSLPPQLMTVAFTTENRVGAVFSGEPLRSQSQIELDSHLFAQFYGGKPILRRLVQIGDVPLYCLQGVTAIEDSDFLEHRGVSPAGLFRALIKNLAHGRYAQGGSTITQQLIKVYFLTSKKTLKRKITELIMAVLLETRVEKDKILSNYLNAIYMAQNGPFQVVGFGAAAQHYFQKPIEELNLSECALLAAIVNSPGRYNPFTSPQNALARRKKVLARMAELQMIDRQMESEANQQSLPSRPPHSLTDPAPYFVQAIEREIQTLGIDDQSGLRIFTTLDEASQEAAQRSISQNLQVLEKTNKLIAQEKSQGKELQASLVAVEVGTGHVIALVGGKKL